MAKSLLQRLPSQMFDRVLNTPLAETNHLTCRAHELDCFFMMKRWLLTLTKLFFHFYTPSKRQNISGFLMFSGDIEIEHCLK